MSGLTAAIQRRQGRAQALQAVALRTAMWGEAQEFARMIERLQGITPQDISDADALAEALGLDAD